MSVEEVIHFFVDKLRGKELAQQTILFVPHILMNFDNV